MEKLIVLLTLIFSFSANATMKSVTFACRNDQWDIIFSTNIDDRAVEVRRAYEYDADTIIFMRIPIARGGPVEASLQISDHGKNYTGSAVCVTEGL